MRRPAIALAILAATLAAGCGNERASLNPALLRPSPQTHVLTAPDAGLAVTLPANLARSPLKSPGQFFATIGRTVVSVYAYRRAEQLPTDKAELTAARKRLVKSTQKRDKTYHLISAKSTRVAKAPAVELLGDQVISGDKVRIRSFHIYKGNVEYVIEIFAPFAEFKRNDPKITPTLLKTLEVSGKVKLPGDEKKKAKKKATQTTTTP